jgi:hypothetical protein
LDPAIIAQMSRTHFSAFTQRAAVFVSCFLTMIMEVEKWVKAERSHVFKMRNNVRRHEAFAADFMVYSMKLETRQIGPQGCAFGNQNKKILGM